MRVNSQIRTLVALALIACMASALPGTARADAPARPWHRGVPAERKQRAQALFAQGGELLERLRLREARARYEAALSHWEHPQIRFYLATVLHKLGRPLDAYENLRQAMRWGAGALEPDEEAEARRLTRALLETELAVIDVRCDEPGAQVAVDGEPWFVGPGAERRVLLPGAHALTARKPGHFPVIEAVTAVAGHRAEITLALGEDEIRFRRRWPAWTPWAVVAGGAVIGLASTGPRAEARIHRAEAEQALRDECGATLPCPAHARLLERARLQERLAAGALVAGGVIAAGGLILAWLNQPRPYHSEDTGGAALEVAPVLSDGWAGISARLSF